MSKTLEHPNTRWRVLDTKGSILFKLGRYEAAEQAMLRAVELGDMEDSKKMLREIQKKLKE